MTSRGQCPRGVLVNVLKAEGGDVTRAVPKGCVCELVNVFTTLSYSYSYSYISALLSISTKATASDCRSSTGVRAVK